MPGAYKCPKCRKRMKFVQARPTSALWRCPRCGTEALITGE